VAGYNKMVYPQTVTYAPKY